MSGFGDFMIDEVVQKNQLIEKLRDQARADAEKIRALEAAVRDAISALDDALGDTDPVIDAEATDEEVRDEQPVFWACQRLSAALAATQSPRSEAGEDVEA